MGASEHIPASGSRGIGSARSEWRQQALLAGLTAFALYHLGLAVWMAAGPRSFFTAVGPFGAYNGHYIRDVAGFEGALGLALLLAIRRPAWRAPVLGLVTVQFALHSANHLLDVEKAHPRWTGWFDFLSLLLSTALLAWLWRTAAGRRIDLNERSAA